MVQKVPSSGSIKVVIKRAEKDDIVDESIMLEPASAIWNNFEVGSILSIGGSGSVVGIPFGGLVDEFRAWNELTENDVFDLQVKYPGLYAGNTTTSARDNLLVRLSFNKPANIGLLGHVMNETPRIGSTATFSTLGFPSITTYPYNMTVLTREVARYTPNAGGNQYTSNKTIVADPPVLQYVSGTTIPILQRDKSIVTLEDKVNKGAPNNIVGFYFSITDAINDSIIRSMGNIDLQNLIGDPSDNLKEQYTELAELSKLYWSSYAYSYNPNRFVEFVDGLLDPLFNQAKKLMPVRAKLLTGIVHEPHILERSKLSWTPVDVAAGQYTRNHENPNLEASPETTQPSNITGESAQIDAQFMLTSSIPIVSEAINQETVLSTTSTFVSQTELYLMTSSVSVPDTTGDIGGETYMLDDLTNFDAYRRQLIAQYGENNASTYNSILQNYQSTSGVNINQISDDASNFIDDTNYPHTTTQIGPRTDFEDLGSSTYFMLPNGTVGDLIITRVRVKQNILADRGTWAQNANYSRNDYVLVGDVEYLCITTSQTFRSQISPELDTSNWTLMKYIPTETFVPRTALVISGSISVAPYGAAGSTPGEYMPYHFKFTRDKRRGIVNHQWLGCLQTDDTTPDGKPAVEILESATDTLVVDQNGSSIQNTGDSSGPILDII
jgi:hypothetical protein